MDSVSSTEGCENWHCQQAEPRSKYCYFEIGMKRDHWSVVVVVHDLFEEPADQSYIAVAAVEPASPLDLAGLAELDWHDELAGVAGIAELVEPVQLVGPVEFVGPVELVAAIVANESPAAAEREIVADVGIHAPLCYSFHLESWVGLL